MKNLVVLSGAGISAESGIRTFRDMGGLWEEHDIMEVASPEGWRKNPNLVRQFYNERRKQLLETTPNKGHRLLKELEKYYHVHVITQNVDDLHERAGSSNILHLHGELKKVRSSIDPKLIYELKGWELKPNEKCEKGSILRPHIVWFGEEVPAISEAVEIVAKADLFVIIGTSLQVYPAAGLISYVPTKVPVFVIDPDQPHIQTGHQIGFISEKASLGMEKLFEKLNLPL